VYVNYYDADGFSALPKEGPEITGEERIYQVGDVISLNCTSGKSFPAARLRWYINGRPVSITSGSCDLKQLLNIHTTVSRVHCNTFVLRAKG
jgi:hypothetical protein